RHHENPAVGDHEEVVLIPRADDADVSATGAGDMHGAPLRPQPGEDGDESSATHHERRRTCAAAFPLLGGWMLGPRPLGSGPGAGPRRRGRLRPQGRSRLGTGSRRGHGPWGRPAGGGGARRGVGGGGGGGGPNGGSSRLGYRPLFGPP